MLRKSSLKEVGAPLVFVAFVACSAGDASEEVSQELASSATPEATAASDQEAELPEGVTKEMIEQGREVFGGAGLCYACHGADGSGMPNLGADLTTGEWLHSDGSFEGIAAIIAEGVPADKSSVGTPMPPKGGSGITDEQVKAVAAYVLVLAAGSK